VRVPWWLGVGGLALLARLAFLWLVDQPLLFTHQYNYFNGGLSIAEHADPWAYILGSDAWHSWNGHWTMAPLYHLFVAAVFKLLGPRLWALQIIQCLLESFTAVMVGVLGRRICASWGAWAGVAYAVHWPSIELPSTTFTENLHTVLLVGAFTALSTPLCRDGSRWVRAGVGGFLLGLSALARAVSFAFLFVAFFWESVLLRRRMAAVALLISGLSPVLPWSLRNLIFMHESVPIETVAFFNLWTDNCFVDRDHYDIQAHVIAKQWTGSARRAQAVDFAWRGLRRSPEAFLHKIGVSFRHFFRPEATHLLLLAELPQPKWRYVVSLLFDDGILLLAAPLFLVYLLAGESTSVRSLLGLWTLYYLFVVVVVFHNEIRYRTAFMPFALAGAVGGAWTLCRSGPRKKALLLIVVCGVLFMVAPYAGPAARAVRSAWALRKAEAALERGKMEEARTSIEEASARAPSSAWPWLSWGGLLARSHHPAEAVEAYRRAELANPTNPAPLVTVPALLFEQGLKDEAQAAQGRANEYSWNADPWLALEMAWDALPPPRRDAIRMAQDDYGAVRGFLHPRGAYRWSRHRAFLRLVPSRPSAHYQVTLLLGSPEPAPSHPVVRVSANGGPWIAFRLDPVVRPFVLDARGREEGILIEIQSPTWSRAGEPAAQGVRVDGMTVTPSG